MRDKSPATLLSRVSVLIILIFLNTCLFGQPKQDYLYYHLGVRNGLVSNEVNGVAQDRQGFIWIATINGLQRYDGRRFLTFNHIPGNPQSLPNDAIYWLHMDSKNRLWMKCRENRMGYFNTSDFTFHEVPVRFPELPLRDADSRLFKDAEDHLLLLLDHRTILTYNEQANEFAEKHNPFHYPAGWAPTFVTQDPKTLNYWIATDSGLVKYSKRDKQASYRGHNVSRDPVIEKFGYARYTYLSNMDNKGRFWFLDWGPGSPAHLYSFDIATGIANEWDPELGRLLKGKYHEIFGFKVQDDGTIWIHGGGIFAKFNDHKNHFELVENNLPGEFSIRYDNVMHLFEDKEHNLWVSTNKGLYRFNPEGQFLRTIPNQRPGRDTVFTPDVNVIIQLQNNDIVVGTWGSGLFAYDNEFNAVKRDYVEQARQLREGMVWCMLQRANGDIWRGNQDGYLFIYHAATKKTEKLRPPVFGRWTIRQMAQDKEGNIWFGTQGGHLVKWSAATETFSLVQRFGSIIFRLYADRKGDIWACTRSHGVFHVNSKTGEIVHNYTAGGPPGERLMFTTSADITQYDDSTYIIASGCLNFLNIRTNKITYFSTTNGLPSNTVNNIVVDKRAQLWVTLESGLSSLTLPKSIVSIYNENDGLPTTTFTTGASCTLNDGRVVLGTAHDMMVFNPGAVMQMDLRPANVVITAFSLMNKSLNVDSLQKLREIVLKPGENSIVIEYSTLTYQNSYGISYMLENLDKGWVRKATGQSQATYNYLPPGTYTFKVRCENGDGIYSEKVTELKIRVIPPFWKTWWFFCILTLLIAGVFYWLDKQRVNRLLAMQKVRTEIASNLHEEVNTTLNNINLLSEMARIKADKDIDRSKEYIDQISTKSHNMIIAMDDILWSIDPENDNMEKSLLRMMEFADALKNRHGATIEIALDKRVRSLKPDMKVRHEVFLIFKDALRLIVQYSGGRNTVVHIDLFKNRLSVKLQDATANLDTNIPVIDEIIRDMQIRSSDIGGELDVQFDNNGIVVLLLTPVK